MKNRIIWIDSVRVFCVLYIVGFLHLKDYLSFKIDMNNFTYQTAYCVLAAFTLITGYFSAGNHLCNKEDVINYYKKKLIRIYPLFTMAGVLFVVCGYNSITTFIKSQVGVGLFIAPFPRTLWFMCMVLVFYLIAPIVLRCDNIKKSILAFLVFETAFCLLYHIGDFDKRLSYYWIFFYIGLLINKNNYQIKKKNILTLVSVVVYFATSIFIGKELNICTIICALSFVYSVSSIAYILFGKQERNRLIEFISYSSMCAYLFHRPIYYFMQSIFGSFGYICAFCVCFPIVIILSWLIQKVYDNIILSLKI